MKKTNNINKLREIINNPYKCTLARLAYYTRCQEDFNFIMQYYFAKIADPEWQNEQIQCYYNCLTGYKEKFIISA